MRFRQIIQLLTAFAAIGGMSLFGEFPQSALVPEGRAEVLHETDAPDFDPEGVLERQLLDITNRHRMEQGLPPLVMDASLMELARRHSADMAQQGFVSHTLPSGSLQARMLQVHYFSEAARENIARTRTVASAHRAFLNSPPHRENILASDVTHIGIGVVHNPALCKEYLYVTEVFARPQQHYSGPMVRDRLENRVNELRQQGLGSLAPDPVLDRIASESLGLLSFPYDRSQIRNLLAASAGELQNSGINDLSRLEMNVQLVHDPKALSIPAKTGRGPAQKYGAAIREVTDRQTRPAYLVLTLVGVAR